MSFELGEGFRPQVDRASEDAADSLFLRVGLEQKKNPWDDVTSNNPQSDATKELIGKVQAATQAPLENALQVSDREKKLVVGLQNGIIAGDTTAIRNNLGELYNAFAAQGRTPDEQTQLVRNDLRVVERVLRQNCSVDINMDVTNDGRAIIRIRPDNLALEIGKYDAKVKRIEDLPGSVSLENGKEVIRPTAAEHARSISLRCITTRSW